MIPLSGISLYSTVHEIVHCESQLLVRDIFMCFEVIWIVHRNHGYSTQCTITTISKIYGKIEFFETCSIHMTSKHIKISLTSNCDSQCTISLTVQYDEKKIFSQIIGFKNREILLSNASTFLQIILQVSMGFVHFFSCSLTYPNHNIATNISVVVKFKPLYWRNSQNYGLYLKQNFLYFYFISLYSKWYIFISDGMRMSAKPE